MEAKEIMTRNVITANETNTIEEVARIFIDKKISGVPVVNKEQKLVGIITEGDLVYQQKKLNPPIFLSFFDGVVQVGKHEFFEELKKVSAFLVKDLMTHEDLITAKEDTDVSDIATMLIENKVNRVPVIDDDEKIIGIITRHDIIKSNYCE